MAKIILIGSYAPSLLNFRGPLLKAITQQGHDVIACAPEINKNTEALLLKLKVTSHSIPLHRTGLSPFKDWKTCLALKKLFLQEKPDIVLSYTIKPVIYSSLAARLANVPNTYSIITGLGYAFIGSTIKQKIISKIAQTLYRVALKNNTRVFFQNPDDTNLFAELKLVMNRQVVMLNGSGVDLNHYRQAPLPDKISFLLIARFIKAKGVLEYIEAASILGKHYPKTKFTLVGWKDPSPGSIDSETLTKWEQDDLIDFKGSLDDVRPAIADTAVYVLPSYREGTPRTVLEAMAMGRPIITTDVPGCRETVIDGINGYLVPVKNSIALAEAMEKFIQHPELIQQMGKEGRKIAEKKYDVHKVNKVIIDTLGLTPQPKIRAIVTL